jgi:hypothetical protein
MVELRAYALSRLIIGSTVDMRWSGISKKDEEGNKLSKSEQQIVYMNVSLLSCHSSNNLFQHITVPLDSFSAIPHRSKV